MFKFIVFTLFYTAFFILNCSAQVPQAIAYQAVARDTIGNPLQNLNIALRFSIHDSIPGGPVVYKETQSATTNLLGLFNVNLGQGTVVSGIFSGINWARFKYLQVELDAAGGSNFINLGTEQMLSVPYAFYSGASTSGWSLMGNAETDTATNFIGTTDNMPLILKVNNQIAGRIDPYCAYCFSNSNNTFIGSKSGANLNPNNYNSGNSNSFFGTQSGYNNSSGQNNSFYGSGSGYQNIIGSRNVAVGNYSMSNNKVSNNCVAIGFQALRTQSFTNGNVAYDADNVAVGHNALASANATSVTENIRNVAVGTYAGISNTTGSSNTFIGWNTGNPSSASADNTTCLGNTATVNTSNKVRIGNTAVTVIEGAVDFTAVSDGRFKNNITEEVKGLDFILKLRPVVYNLDTRKFDEFLSGGKTERLKGTDYSASTAIRRSGFIAQEVEAAANEIGYDFNGLHIPVNENDNYGIAYASFTVPLVKAIQELHQKNKTLTSENETLKGLLNSIQARLEVLESKDERTIPSTAALK